MPVYPFLPILFQTLLTCSDLYQRSKSVQDIFNLILLVHQALLQLLQFQTLCVHINFVCLLELCHQLLVVGCQAGIVVMLLALNVHYGSIFLAVVRLPQIDLLLDLMQV